MRLLGKKFIPGFRIETNDEDEDDEQLMPPTVNGGIHIAQIEQDELEAQQTFSNTEPLAVNEPTEQTVVRNVAVNEPTEQTVVRNVRYITNIIKII